LRRHVGLNDGIPAVVDFVGRVAIVTGAGKGLGRAHARYLAARGAAVIVNNRRHAGEEAGSSADGVVAEIVGDGGLAVADYGDASDPASGERMVSKALARFGRLDILIANAGISEAVAFRKQELDDFRHLMEVNFFGTLAVAHAAFRAMYAAGYGRILLTTSTAGLYGDRGLPAYSASKAAVIGLMRVLSLEGRRAGVLANALAPYATTRMTEALTPKELHAPLDPDKVAPVAAWLVSEGLARTGGIFLAGGGALRVARMMESASIAVPAGEADLEKLVAALEADGEFRPMDSAQAEFEDFLVSLDLSA
jgi:NAD(P)-dependent dehydrogenase (short-subunit alcohol dehydrogenase family)